MFEYTHQLSPYIWQIYGTFGFRWYGLSYLLGFVLAFYLFKWRIRIQRSFLLESQLSDFLVYGAFGVLIGGRLGYVLFYHPETLFEWSFSFPFWGLLEIHKGGMSSHGGILGVIFACFLYARKVKVPFLHLLDLTTLAGAIGFFFGRIANFINGELYGRLCEGKCFLGVRFPQEVFRWLEEEPHSLHSLAPVVEKFSQRHPIAGYSVDATEWSLWVTQWMQGASYVASRAQQSLSSWLSYMMERASQYPEEMGDFFSVLNLRHPSQIYQSLLEGLFVFLLLLWVWRKPRLVGVISACFGFFYATARILGEQFRMPDVGIGFEWLGLTRGQSLSVGLLLISMIMLFFSLRFSKKVV